jgi:hypothetical protein
VDELIRDNPDAIVHWLKEKAGILWADDFSGFTRKLDGKIVSAVGYNGHNGSSCSIHLAVGWCPSLRSS